MSLHFVHFNALTDIALPGVAEMAYKDLTGIREKAEFAHVQWRFRDAFLPAVNDKDYYVFITTVEQEEIFQTHVKQYGMEPYLFYQSPFTFPNARYDLNPRLNLRIYKFTEEFINKIKEMKK